MSRPSEMSWAALKRAVRFLLGAPRTVWVFSAKPMSGFLDVFTDSDHAGCQSTRRSTPALAVVWNGRLLKTQSTTQTVASLSSGESEFYSIVKATSAGLGMVAMSRDFGWELKLRIWRDASAGRGIASRRGAGKVRHMATQTLWA